MGSRTLNKVSEMMPGLLEVTLWNALPLSTWRLNFFLCLHLYQCNFQCLQLTKSNIICLVELDNFSKTINLFNLVLKMSDNEVNATNDCFTGHLTSWWTQCHKRSHIVIIIAM